jgi:hypothetical protein
MGPSVEQLELAQASPGRHQKNDIHRESTLRQLRAVGRHAARCRLERQNVTFWRKMTADRAVYLEKCDKMS